MSFFSLSHQHIHVISISSFIFICIFILPLCYLQLYWECGLNQELDARLQAGTRSQQGSALTDELEFAQEMCLKEYFRMPQVWLYFLRSLSVKETHRFHFHSLSSSFFVLHSFSVASQVQCHLYGWLERKLKV